MRVLYVIDSLAPGGAERSLVSIAPHLRQRGVDLGVVVVHDRPGLRSEVEGLGIGVCSLAPVSRPDRVRELSKLIRQRRPHLVHTTLFEADIAGRVAAALAGIPSVSTFATDSYGSDHLRQPGVRATRLRLAQAADAATARLVRRFHAVSEGVAATMARRLGVSRRRIDVVHRGRDDAVLGRRSRARAEVTRAALGVAPSSPLLVAVARHEYDKGLDIAVRAMPKIKLVAQDAVLVIVGGEGNQTETLVQLAGGALQEGTTRLLGPRDDVADLLAAADVFLAPSRREGLPGSVLEAMALEAPIVASDLPGTREAVGAPDDCARLVPVGSVDSLVSAVIDVLRTPEMARARAIRARHRFEDRFTVDRAASGMVAFYERALGG